MLTLIRKVADNHRRRANRASALAVQGIAQDATVLPDKQCGSGQGQARPAGLAETKSRIGAAVAILILEADDRSTAVHRRERRFGRTGRTVGHDVDRALGADCQMTCGAESVRKDLRAPSGRQRKRIGRWRTLGALGHLTDDGQGQDDPGRSALVALSRRAADVTAHQMKAVCLFQVHVLLPDAGPSAHYTHSGPAIGNGARERDAA